MERLTGMMCVKMVLVPCDLSLVTPAVIIQLQFFPDNRRFTLKTQTHVIVKRIDSGEKVCEGQLEPPKIEIVRLEDDFV